MLPLVAVAAAAAATDCTWLEVPRRFNVRPVVARMGGFYAGAAFLVPRFCSVSGDVWWGWVALRSWVESGFRGHLLKLVAQEGTPLTRRLVAFGFIPIYSLITD